MELWEAQAAVNGLPYRDRYVLDALRLIATLQFWSWSSGNVSPTDLIRYPWDDEADFVSDMDDEFDRDALLDRSEGYLSNISE